MMKKRWAKWVIIIALGIFAAAPISWACSNLGPGKHMGVIRSIDPIGGVLVLIDAETRKPIRFLTSDDLLKTVKVNDTVVVVFKNEKGRLVARDIVVHLGETGSL
ncbi:MAG: hypothetical protein ACE5HN_02155 [Nitrospiria bacterium]